MTRKATVLPKWSSVLGRRAVVLALIALVATVGAPVRAAVADESPTNPDGGFRDVVLPFVTENCLACHGGDEPRGDLDLRRFTTTETVAADFPQWEAIRDQLETGAMPPDDAKRQPTDEQRRAVIAWIESFRAFEARRNAGDPGVVLARRLSNAEYDLTIRDLTGIDIRPAREFPVDPANTAGFDNTGESLAMSPALVDKYLAAARNVSEHLVLLPEGLDFAPFPVMTNTDRDKYGVRRIIDFYERQPTDLAAYFAAAWRFEHRAQLGIPAATLADVARAAEVSPRYLDTVWSVLHDPAPEFGPVAATRALWNGLPAPNDAVTGDGEPAELRRECERISRFVTALRRKVQVQVRNLRVRKMNDGAQALVLWKDREMAANRRTYGGGGAELDVASLRIPGHVARLLVAPEDEADQRRFETEFERFCSVFPDAFYVSERGRVFLDPKEDRLNTGRLLSAGFHNQMGYFRDDQPLRELILDEAEREELDTLWTRFLFASDVPARMHSGLIWFERSESAFLFGEEFDFARAEDKDVTSEAKFARFVEEYTKRAEEYSRDETVHEAVREHFVVSKANIRWIEKLRNEAESRHVAALQEFAGRAYRRRLTAEERGDIAAFYRLLREEDGIGHEEAVRDTLVAMLMSPYFCYRVDLPSSQDDPPSGTATAVLTEPLSDEALASRLSYFLWSSMPDDELVASAANGTLHEPQVLKGHVRRMLQDDRLRGLVTQFGGNWLDFRRFEEHNAVDRGRFPEFDDELRAAMAEEPVRFLLDIVRHDRSVLELLDAQHTFVNAPLAAHYGMNSARGWWSGRESTADEWIRIDDARTFGRGGLLPMAVFQTKNSPGLRTSPVKRGYWVVTRLLGERIPPPPPNVPELPNDERELGETTLREALAEHRRNENCSVCHDRFDAFGLAFEGFGPIGERRKVDLAGRAVETLVTFPDGTEGAGLEGLRDYVVARRRDDFLDNLCRKLLAYGLGRSLLLSDDATVAAMRTNLERDDHRFVGLVETIVTSPQFLNRRAPRPAEQE